MKYFWQLSNCIAALYGAAVIGLAAALMHLGADLSSSDFGRLVSAISILAFQLLALLIIGRQSGPAKLITAVAFVWHVGIWLFVWTLCAGVLALPFYYSALAPAGGQILIIGWLLLALSAWQKDTK